MVLKNLTSNNLLIEKKKYFFQTLYSPISVKMFMSKQKFGYVFKIIGNYGSLEYKIKIGEVAVVGVKKNSFLFFGTKRGVKTQIRNLSYLLIGVNRPFFSILKVKGIGFKLFSINNSFRFELGQTHPLFYCCRYLLNNFVYKKNSYLYFKSINFTYLR